MCFRRPPSVRRRPAARFPCGAGGPDTRQPIGAGTDDRYARVTVRIPGPPLRSTVQRDRRDPRARPAKRRRRAEAGGRPGDRGRWDSKKASWSSVAAVAACSCGPKPTLAQPPPQVPGLGGLPVCRDSRPEPPLATGSKPNTQSHQAVLRGAPARVISSSEPEQAGEVDRREAGPILDELHPGGGCSPFQPSTPIKFSTLRSRPAEARSSPRTTPRRPPAARCVRSGSRRMRAATIGDPEGDDVSTKTSVDQGVSAILGPQGLERGVALDHHARALHGAAIHGAHRVARPASARRDIRTGERRPWPRPRPRTPRFPVREARLD